MVLASLCPARYRSTQLTNEKKPERYVCILDPTNAWTVWDSEMEMPASLGGQHLTGRPKERAEAARAILERIHKSKLERIHEGKADGG